MNGARGTFERKHSREAVDHGGFRTRQAAATGQPEEGEGKAVW